MINYKHVVVDGTKIFYREAGNAQAPGFLLLHGHRQLTQRVNNVVKTIPNTIAHAVNKRDLIPPPQLPLMKPHSVRSFGRTLTALR